MSDVQNLRMTVDEFLAWAEHQPGRHELVGGKIFSVSPERPVHADVKFAVQAALKTGIRVAGLPCFTLPDGLTVRIDDSSAFEPDALAYHGNRIAKTAVEVPEPLVVVEVLSPSTRNYDAGAKRVGYFMLPSLHHYLMIDPDREVVVHHRRDGEAIATRILGAGTIRLDPPGLDVAVEALFEKV